MIEILGKTNIDFIGKQKITMAISATLLLLGLIGIVRLSLGTGNMGIDFVGGSSVQLNFENKINMADARKALEKNGIKGADLQEILTGNSLLVRIKRKEALDEKISERVIETFRESFPQNSFTVDSTSDIGPTIGAKLRKDTLVAIILSTVGIILYIAMRFELRFGIAAAIATFHDVIVVIGVFYLMNKEFSLLIVTALLTLAGYSLTDTVVVFDRIRENMKKRKSSNFIETVNTAINEVLGRTVVTSLTTLLVLASLFVFGGEVLHDFALALLVGVCIGNYSSLFVASPILVVMDKKKRKAK